MTTALMEPPRVRLAERRTRGDYARMKASRQQAAPERRHVDVARLIRAARAAKKMSQGDLVRVSGVQKQTVYRAESGQHRPETPAALAFIDVLEIPPSVMRAAIDGDSATVDGYISSLGAAAADVAREWAEGLGG